MKRHRLDKSFQHGGYCNAKYVAGRRDKRDAGKVGGASTALMAVDGGAQCFVLPKCLDNEQVGCSSLRGIPRAVFLDDV